MSNNKSSRPRRTAAAKFVGFCMAIGSMIGDAFKKKEK